MNALLSLYKRSAANGSLFAVQAGPDGLRDRLVHFAMAIDHMPQRLQPVLLARTPGRTGRGHVHAADRRARSHSASTGPDRA